MPVSVIRLTILYIIVNLAVRLMGKRQIGELQPSELVITILLSEIAAIPMEDNSIPIINPIIAIALLVSFEIINSVLSMRSSRIRKLLQGNSILIIKDGEPDLKQIKRLRLTIEDILEALRQRDVFDIADVQYAILETTGKISVLLKPKNRNVTVEMLGVDARDAGLPEILVYDGEIQDVNYGTRHIDTENTKTVLKKAKIDAEKLLLLSRDKSGKMNTIKKEEGS